MSVADKLPFTVWMEIGKNCDYYSLKALVSTCRYLSDLRNEPSVVVRAFCNNISISYGFKRFNSPRIYRYIKDHGLEHILPTVAVTALAEAVENDDFPLFCRCIIRHRVKFYALCEAIFRQERPMIFYGFFDGTNHSVLYEEFKERFLKRAFHSALRYGKVVYLEHLVKSYPRSRGMMHEILLEMLIHQHSYFVRPLTPISFTLYIRIYDPRDATDDFTFLVAAAKAANNTLIDQYLQWRTRRSPLSAKQIKVVLAKSCKSLWEDSRLRVLQSILAMPEAVADPLGVASGITFEQYDMVTLEHVLRWSASHNQTDNRIKDFRDCLADGLARLLLRNHTPIKQDPHKFDFLFSINPSLRPSDFAALLPCPGHAISGHQGRVASLVQVEYILHHMPFIATRPEWIEAEGEQTCLHRLPRLLSEMREFMAVGRDRSGAPLRDAKGRKLSDAITRFIDVFPYKMDKLVMRAVTERNVLALKSILLVAKPSRALLTEALMRARELNHADILAQLTVLSMPTEEYVLDEKVCIRPIRSNIFDLCDVGLDALFSTKQ